MNSATIEWIRKSLIKHSCTGGVKCTPPPPSGTTMHPLPRKSKEELRAAIDVLDLGCIKYKLMHPADGEAWTKEKADRVETLYKRFLFMAVTDPRPFMPTSEIDDMWHAHILDTAKYVTDCEATFGFFLHHFPYFGLRGDRDVLNMVRLFIENCHRYETEYHESYAVIPEEFLRIPELLEKPDVSSAEFLQLAERPSADLVAA